MYEKLEECPGCKHTKFNNFLICKDYTVSKESFALVKCSKCQLVFTNPRPTTKSITKYYESEDYISHTNNSTDIINFIYKGVRSFTLQQKYNHITKYVTSGKVLDFGCGTGHFLRKMKNKGWDIDGLEPDQRSRNIASEKLNTQIKSNLEEFEKTNKYSVITAWHVLEHVHELKKTLKFLYSKLDNNGYLFIALPNHNSLDSMLYKEYWAAYDVPRHLYHFSQQSFQRIAKSTKLQLIDTIPMVFDSYYVSLLSEKNQGYSNFLKAVKAGFDSNKQARLKTGEYSSIIYVLTK